MATRGSSTLFDLARGSPASSASKRISGAGPREAVAGASESPVSSTTVRFPKLTQGQLLSWCADPVLRWVTQPRPATEIGL